MSEPKSIALVLGTRPELIKLSPVIRELRRRGAPFTLIHTGQHYSPPMDANLRHELEVPEPDVRLQADNDAPARQLPEIIRGVGEAIERLQPAMVMVQGDTQSVLGGALAAWQCGVRVAHLEAGLRSDDWTMPEEGNRVLAGRVAALHFCPTALQADRLRAEGIADGVHVVGNTVVDACLWAVDRIAAEPRPQPPRRYAFVTVHRPSNVDHPERLEALLLGLEAAARELHLELVFPIHPHTAERMSALGLAARLDPALWRLLAPSAFLPTIALLRDAEVVITDSGGVQEEACILRVPTVTLRPNTERPETVSVGANQLCPATQARDLVEAIREMRARPRTWNNPFGDGHTAERVVEILLASLD